MVASARQADVAMGPHRHGTDPITTLGEASTLAGKKLGNGPEEKVVPSNTKGAPKTDAPVSQECKDAVWHPHPAT